jgi:hypothetical protein
MRALAFSQILAPFREKPSFVRIYLINQLESGPNLVVEKIGCVKASWEQVSAFYPSLALALPSRSLI